VSASAAQQFAPLDTAPSSVAATRFFTIDESRAFVINAHETTVRFLRFLCLVLFPSVKGHLSNQQSQQQQKQMQKTANDLHDHATVLA